ncbi:MAG: ferredoxin reductase family protein [Acidimicrobiales bacterium]
MVGSYLALLMVLLISRIPLVERVMGQDGLLRWHRRLAPWPIGLLAAHAVFITVGYAQAAHSGLLHEVGTLLGSYPGIITASVGLALMLVIGLVSLRAIRTRLRRETWWIIHLYMYVALSISFAHVIALGPSFVGHPLARLMWSVLWAATAGVVITYRFGLPILRSLRHRLTVVEVRREAPGVVSIICRGQKLERLRVKGGQFFEWRFLTPGLWWQAHPYSLSRLPQPRTLRLTVKDVGDHSRALADLRPGTKVAFEGPYGAFTREACTQRKVALIAGGIGVTALRCLLEDLPRSSDPVVVLRASTEEDLVLNAEVAELVKNRRGRLHEVVGRRHEAALDGRTLFQLIPDLFRRDVFVCGPEGFVADLSDILGTSGMPSDQVHYEAYAL